MENKILIKNIILKGEKKDILIEGNLISKIGDLIDFSEDELLDKNNRVIDGASKTVIPSFINMHTHAGMTLLRGYREDAPLFDWLHSVWAVEDHIDGEMIYWATRLACLEMIKTGTTAYNDMYFSINEAAKAVEDAGIRALFCCCLCDAGNEARKKFDRERLQIWYEDSKKWNNRVKFCVGLHAPYTVCEENIVWACEFAREHNLLIHTHIAETEKEFNDILEQKGLSPVQYMDKIGALADDVISAHSLWLDEKDVEILGKRGVHIVHNINSNLKLASGYAFKYSELRDAGANICLGTDGAGSSNNLDMLETMKTSALMQKGWRRDSTAMPIAELLDTTTVNAAKALRLNAGKIEEGYLADFLLINTNSYAFLPDFNFEANLIYSANNSCIDTVVCDGKVLMENRIVPGEEEIMKNFKIQLERLMKS